MMDEGAGVFVQKKKTAPQRSLFRILQIHQISDPFLLRCPKAAARQYVPGDE